MVSVQKIQEWGFGGKSPGEYSWLTREFQKCIRKLQSLHRKFKNSLSKIIREGELQQKYYKICSRKTKKSLKQNNTKDVANESVMGFKLRIERFLFERYIRVEIQKSQIIIDLMRNLLVVALCLAVVSAEIIPFNKDAIDKIFKEKATTLFLFTSTGKESEDALAAFNELDDTAPSGVLLAHSSSEDGHGLYNRLAEYIGVDLSTVPTVVYLANDGTKYALEGEYTLETLREFLGKAEDKELEPFLKSHPIPESNDAPVKIIVGKTFKSIVLDTEKEVLVKFYAPWCGHCKTLAPEFDKAAEALLKQNPNVILAKVDSTGNEVAGIEVQGYPTLKWWKKDKSQGPVEYNGGRNAEGILTWIKEHTEFPWVNEQAEEAAPAEEAAAPTETPEQADEGL